LREHFPGEKAGNDEGENDYILRNTRSDMQRLGVNIRFIEKKTSETKVEPHISTRQETKAA
jgi:hypothetical protein